MHAVATTCLGRGSWPGEALLNLCQAPLGVTLIVKSVVLDNRGTSSANMQLTLATQSGVLQVRLAAIVLEPGAQLLVEGWHVLNETDALLAYSSSGAVSYWVSGTALQGDSPFTPTAGTVLLD